MNWIENAWHPRPRQLRQFGIAAGLLLPLAGWLANAGGATCAGLAISGGVLAAISWRWPRVLLPLYGILTLIGLPLALVVSEGVLLIIFYIVLGSLGIVFRLLGRDGLLLKRDRQATSYWRPKAEQSDVSGYFRQS